MYKGFIPYSYFIHLRFTFHCQALPSVYIYNLTSQSLSHKLLRASLSGGYYPSHTERSCPSRTLNKDRQSIDHTANTLRLQHNSGACKHHSTKYKTHWTLPLIPLVDRKSTRLNSSHVRISYAVFCLKKKKYDETSQ